MARAVHAAAGSAASRKAASVNSSGQDGGRQQGFVYAVLVPGSRGGRGARSGSGRQGSPEPGSRGFRGCWGGGEKVLANSTCGVFVSPMEAPAAEITTWGRRGGRGGWRKCCWAPSPQRRSLLLGSGAAGTLAHHLIRSGAKDVPGLGDSPRQGFGTHPRAPAPV